MWIKIGLVAAVLMGFAVPKAFQAAQGTPSFPDLKPVTAKRFTAICKAGQIIDARPAPTWVGESFQGDGCRAPRLPSPLNGYTATREQIVGGMATAKAYAAAADGFETCVGNFVTARRAEAEHQGKPLGGALTAIESHRIAVSEKNKQLASARMDAAINAFNEYGSDCPDH